MVEEAFRPFRRLTPTDGNAAAGTGLGLSIARSIVRGLGGDIELMNRDDRGLQVTIVLPRSLSRSQRNPHPVPERGVRQAHMAA
jgi:signal transduction histidine kinase